ncbi:MAG TPA: DMT family transporter [Thermodesulfobacteriota bacterium]
MTPAARGSCLVAAAAVCWGAQPTLTKLLFVQRLGPVELSALRAVIALALLAGLLAAAAPKRLLVARTDLPLLALFGVAGMALVNWAYFVNIRHNTVATAVLLAQTAPVIVAPLSAVLFRERIGRRVRAACALSVLGALVMVSGGGAGPLALNVTGLAAGLFCALAYAVYTLLGKRVLVRHDASTVLVYALLFATLFWGVVAPRAYRDVPDLTRDAWAGLLALSTVSTLVPFALSLRGMSLLAPTRAAIMLTLEPVAAIVIAWLALGEPLGPFEAAGGALVVGAALLVQRQA